MTTALANAPLVLLVISTDGVIVGCEGGLGLLSLLCGTPPIGQSLADSPFGAGWVTAGLEACLRGEARNGRGELGGRWFECNWTPVRERDHVSHATALLIDVTRHVQADRLQRAEAEVLSRVAADGTLEDVLELLCRALELDHPGTRVSFRKLSTDGSRLEHLVSPSLPEAMGKGAPSLPVGPDGGSSGLSAASGRPVVTTNTATDPLWARYRALAETHRIPACWSLPIKNSGGGVVGTIALFPDSARSPTYDEIAAMERAADIAAIAIERRAAHAAIQRSEAEYRALVDSLKQVVFRVDLLGCWTFLSQAWVTLTGKRIDDSLGRPLIDFVHPDDRNATIDVLQRLAIEPTVPQESELRVLSPSGELRRVELRLTAQRDADGAFAGATGTLADVTEARFMRAQLMTADRMASVGMLAAGVAHEINNPLAAIVANVDYVRTALRGDGPPEGMTEQELSDEVSSSLDDASEAARRVRDIVQDLRVLSRVDKRERGLVDVQRTLEGTIRIAWNEIRHRARLTRDYAAIPPVAANEAELGQVFLNLLINAAQSIPSGHSDHHEIRVVTRTDSAGRAVIEVHDTGAGMAPEVVRELFEPFFTTKPPGIGTGLGLAICRRTVVSLGGCIEARSEPGRGSVFQVVLPSGIGTAPDADKPDSVAPESVPPVGSILLIDDDLVVATAVRRSLRSRDVTVMTSPLDALDKLRSGTRFDVILSDMSMPTMSGRQLYREVLSLDPKQAERMVFLTGGVFDEGLQQFLDGRPNQTIAKPFDPSELRAAVRSTIERARSVSWEPPAAPAPSR